MKLENKVRVYKTCVRSIMTYAMEMRTKTTATKRLLRTAEMRILKCITGNTLRDRIRNEDICNTCKIQDVIRWARMRRRTWRYHVEKMDDSRLAKIAKNGKVNCLDYREGRRNGMRVGHRHHRKGDMEDRI